MVSKICISIIFIFLFIRGTSQNKPDRIEFFPKTELRPVHLPAKENIWVFLLAGQSNMAGRGQVEPMDTLSNPRILSINKSGDIIIAKEPLHFYDPPMTGLDCGLSFGNELLNYVPDSVYLLIIPTAIGGSSISQWINDSTHRKVPLLSNFREKTNIGKQTGEIKGILWHQGESDAASEETIKIYDEQLRRLFTIFRGAAGNMELPIFMGELGSYSKTPENWKAINNKMADYVETDPSAYLIKTSDLIHKGDSVHFNSESQRILGQRFADKFVNRDR